MGGARGTARGGGTEGRGHVLDCTGAADRPTSGEIDDLEKQTMVEAELEGPAMGQRMRCGPLGRRMMCSTKYPVVPA